MSKQQKSVAPAPADASAGQDEQVLGQGKFLKLVRRGKWEYVQRINSTGVVGIIATTGDGRLVLVDQWRAPLGKRCIELPAGLVGDEDSSEGHAQSAARELEEETGYRAAWMEPVVEGASSAGLSGETVALFRAGGLERVHGGGGTGSEQIVVLTVPLAEVPAYLRSRAREGWIVDLKVWAALWLVGR